MKSQDILLLLKLSSIGQSAPAMPPLLDAGSRVMQEGGRVLGARKRRPLHYARSGREHRH
jgi:hypothetical protein